MIKLKEELSKESERAGEQESKKIPALLLFYTKFYENTSKY